MRPKPVKRPGSGLNTPEHASPMPSSPLRSPDLSSFATLEFPAIDTSGSSDSPSVKRQRPDDESAVEISTQAQVPARDVVSPAVFFDIDPLGVYRLSDHTRNLLPDVDGEGFRVRAGRRYVDLDNEMTVQVAWDDSSQAYRAKHRHEREASGPVLYLNDDRKTWSPGLLEFELYAPQTTARPLQPAAQRTGARQPDPSPVDTRYYVWNEGDTNHHGYVALHRKKGFDDFVGPPLRWAFRDDNGQFIGVVPSAENVDVAAPLLPAWTDRNLWDFYGIHGDDISRFRSEAHASGKKPQWAIPRPQRKQRVYLLDELRRWLNLTIPQEIYVRRMARHSIKELLDSLERVSLKPFLPSASPSSASHRQASTSGPSSTRPSVIMSPVRKARAPVYGDHSHYTWKNVTSLQGYVVMNRKPGLSDSEGPAVQFAFHDGTRLINVQPTPYWHTMAALRPWWSDRLIWHVYRLEGVDLQRFRAESAATGLPPGWAKHRQYPSAREQWIDHLRLWTSPHNLPKTATDYALQLQPFNLSIAQLERLAAEVNATGQFPHCLDNQLPQWARQHKKDVLDPANPDRFEPFVAEFNAEILGRRNHAHAPYSLKEFLNPVFFEQLLSHVGYQRNLHNCLFRTDIPAMFRGDDRTPFEFARDGVMMPRARLGEGSTTMVAVSATFSLRESGKYIDKLDSEALGYDSQYDGQPALADSAQTDSDSDSPNSPQPTATGAAVSKRQTQAFGFNYLLDTRNIEVVPGRENNSFNRQAIEQPDAALKTWFPDDDLEGHISVSSQGFDARRIWLLNSGMTRAARVSDIYRKAREAGTDSATYPDNLEARTWAGDQNRSAYDALIDQVAASGQPVLEFPAAAEVFSNDVIFPPTVTP